MKKYLRYATYILFVIGLAMCFIGVWLADGYIIDWSQDPPRYVWRLLAGGVLMMIPAAVRMIRNEAQYWEWDWS